MWQAAMLVRCAQSGRATARNAQYRLRRQCVYCSDGYNRIREKRTNYLR